MRKISILFGPIMLLAVSLFSQEKISFTDLVTIDFNQLAKSKEKLRKNDREYSKLFDQ